MPYVEVKPADLQIGQEYVLTLKGIESRTEGAEFENVPILSWNGKRTGSTRKQMKRPATVVAPPTAAGQLLTAYRALQTWQMRDGPGAYSYSYKNKPAPIDINTLRMKGYFAGTRANGLLVFTQLRPFGSKKAAEPFIPVANLNEGHPGAFKSYNGVWYGLKHKGFSPADYAFWKMQANNTRRNESALATGNLLGLNNVPLAKENTRTAAQALNNAYQQHEMEQLFKGGRKTRRSRFF